MAEIIMPKMGDAMSEGKVVRWYKKPGDAVKKGEPLLEIETDKVNLDLEAESDGTLSELQADEGTVVPVGGVLAYVLGEGEKAAPKSEQPKSEQRAAGGEQEKPEPEQRRATDRKDSVKHSTGEYGEAIEMKGPRVDKTAAAPAPAAAAAQASGEGERRKSSPLARKMARELGVRLEALQGSGPQGRIVAADVKNFQGAPAVGRAEARPTSLTSERIPLSGMRRTIAKRLAESTGPIPHFYLTADYDVTQLLAVRQQLIDIEGVKISLNDFIIRGAALAMQQHPLVNASWGDDFIGQHAEVHIGVAVSTPEGLITPVVRNADTKSVREISEEVRALAEKAKNRKLTPNEYQGSTFTISNLGAWGIEEFTAIINPPNVAILAIGAAEARPVVLDRQIVIRDRMKITMSCDHRVIDGAAGAEYLRTLRQYLEQPLRLVM
ncbi:MAG TPA: dihydrolipoamide acetyltransferase family protein [Thermoanaerobaculia bacterium]|jgi:pyruvate dehydrogenase E2 component (dihydrolipoamide acetyltransferase)|nr:dihydrolipoamide acetyltransferase family protein [Thermoanaerobaculia bacterium]